MIPRKMHSNSDILIEKIIDSEGELMDNIFYHKFKKDEIENRYQIFRKEFFNDKIIFFAFSIFVFLINNFFIYLTYDNIIILISFSIFCFIDSIIFIFSIVHFYKKKNFSLIYKLTKIRLYVIFIPNLIAIILLLIKMNHFPLIFILNFYLFLQIVVLFAFFDNKNIYFALGFLLNSLIMIFFFYNQDGDFKDKNFLIKFNIFYFAVLGFMIIINKKINKFLRLMFFENFKLKKLIINKSRQMEGFNFLEFVWLNNENNYINKNLKEFLNKNKEILIKENEENFCSSSNFNLIPTNSNKERLFHGNLYYIILY
jgi:hypothetical protein